jgi:hypothetical protein
MERTAMDQKHQNNEKHNGNGLFTYSKTTTYGQEDTHIYVVRESKFYEKEWYDLKRPICFANLKAALQYVESQIDELQMSRKSKGEEELTVERLGSSMTWYRTIRTVSKKPVVRFEVYLSQLF